jgi:type III restriction enzyme
LIRKQKGPDGKEHFYRLDVGKEAVRKQVLKVASNDQLDSIFNAAVTLS